MNRRYELWIIVCILNKHLTVSYTHLRTIHLFEENKRVQKAVQALKENNFDVFKNTVKASGQSSFKYLQNIYSNHDTDNQAVSIAIALSEELLKEYGVCRVQMCIRDRLIMVL